ncbi:MAG: hypothetical protein JWO68_3187, partial [Actinomycetia bacterium]|nr:hypothetical protein [Actinomycetes bacterium]
PVVGVGAAVVWALVARLTRRASVASIVVAAAIPVGAAVAGATGIEAALLAVTGAAVVARHAGNIARLARGAEHPTVAGRS